MIDLLARGLRDAGHQVMLFATGDSTCPVPTCHVFSEADRDRMGWSVPEAHHVLAAYRALRDSDVVHDHTILGPLLAPLLGKPRVITTNHAPFTEELREIYGVMDDRVAIVAISRDQASRAPGLRIARVIHHGLEPAAYAPGPGGGGYVLFLGRMCADKGVDRAARVARAAGRRLLIAAKMEEPSEHCYFRREVEPLLGPDVIYLGEADRTTKRRLLAGAEALLNPIRWPEPFGLVMIEALAMGSPVVAFPEGAAPEIIEHGVTGFLCEDEDEMVEALGRIGELDRRVCRRHFEERFSARRMVEEYLALYREVVETGHLARSTA